MRIARCLVALTAICSFASALDLQCARTHKEDWWDGEFFTCDIAKMEITKRGEVMTSAVTVADFNQVKALKISNQIMNYFPKFTDELGQRIEVLVVQSSHLKAIERDDLRPFPLLRVLDLWNNDMTSLPGDLLLSTQKLEFIDVSLNPLKSVGSDIFKPLSNLRQADFRTTGCIDMGADIPEEIEAFILEMQTRCKPGEKANTLGEA